jgi:hypothetical protein
MIGGDPPAGRWVPAALAAGLGLLAAGCSAPPSCVDGTTTALACGLNDRGSQIRACVNGGWAAPGACRDPDACIDGSMESPACGINGRGSQTRVCVNGAWHMDACADPDGCVDGSAQSFACGLNDRGTQDRTCVAGAWSTPGCVDPDECVDGTTEASACGFLGSQTQPCTLGHWGPGACVAPVFIAAPGRRDMVDDAKRGRVYITTFDGGGQVASYNLATEAFEAPLLVGGTFMGIDLSPDGDQLLVADSGRDSGHSWIYRIDLTTGAAQKISFSLSLLDAQELGTFSAVFTSNTEALDTSRFSGSGTVPLRRVDLTSGTAQKLADVDQDTMLAVSADRSTVGGAEANLDDGPLARYDVGAQTLTTGVAGRFIDEIAVDRTGSQFAVPAGLLLIFDRSFGQLAAIGSAGFDGDLAIGAAYSPIRDEIYVAWKSKGRSLDVYSSTTLRKLRDIAPIPQLFGDPEQQAFQFGRLRVSRDGTRILATTSGGIAIYPTGP